MAETKEETKKIENAEREYVIPLRKSLNKVPRYKRANKAIKTIKEFLAKHMKVIDRDVKKVRLDKYLNEAVWFRGIRNPPSKIKVKVTRETETGIVRVELLELPEKLKFKKIKLEKRDKAAEKTKKAAKPETKAEKDQAEKTEEKKAETLEEKETRPSDAELEEKKEEAKEKKAAVVEAGKEMTKKAAKRAKHQTKISKQPKHQFRKALSK